MTTLYLCRKDGLAFNYYPQWGVPSVHTKNITSNSLPFLPTTAINRNCKLMSVWRLTRLALLKLVGWGGRLRLTNHDWRGGFLARGGERFKFPQNSIENLFKKAQKTDKNITTIFSSHCSNLPSETDIRKSWNPRNRLFTGYDIHKKRGKISIVRTVFCSH